jgi:hypothetical protein
MLNQPIRKTRHPAGVFLCHCVMLISCADEHYPIFGTGYRNMHTISKSSAMALFDISAFMEYGLKIKEHRSALLF